MATNYVQPGEVMPVTLSGTVAPGTAALVGDFLGVHLNGGVSGDVDQLQIEGVWSLPKIAAQVQAIGVQLYWDNDESHLTTVASTHKKAGKVFKAALAADTHVEIKLNA